MANDEIVELSDVQIRTKIPKTTKTNKPYWILETNKGSVMCFDAALASKLMVSETAVYKLSAAAPKDGYKSYTLKSVNDIAERPAGSVPAAAPSAAPAAYGGGSYRAPAAAMGRDAGTDIRISKLSVFAAIAQIQAAKIKVNPDMAQASTAAIVCETMDLTKAVLKELMYPIGELMGGAAAAATPIAPVAATVPVSEEPPFNAPAQPAAQPAGQPALFPAVTPKPEAAAPAAQAPAPAAQPAQPPVLNPQSDGDKAAQAKALFGVKSDLESAMAARVAKMLGK